MRRLLSLFLLIALLAGCSAAPELPGGTPLPNQPDAPGDQNATAVTGDGEPVTVSYAVWDYEQQIYEPLAKKFTAEHPNITIALVSLDDMMNVSPQQQPGPEGPLT